MITYIIIGLLVLLLITLLVIAWFAGVTRLNRKYDEQVIARGREPNLDDSAGQPTKPHPRPASAVSAVGRNAPYHPSEAVGASKKPACAGSSFIQPPDDMDLGAPDARERLAAMFQDASWRVLSHDDTGALDKGLMAVHALSCALRERKADSAGVVIV